jgi:hypothetical protein
LRRTPLRTVLLLPPKYYVSNSLINVRNCLFILKIADRLFRLRLSADDAHQRGAALLILVNAGYVAVLASSA